MKILIVTDSFHTGGKERRLIELLKGLVSRGVYCELIALSDVVQYEDLYSLDIKIHFLKRRYNKDISIFGKLAKIVREIQPDIIQSWSSMASIYLIPVLIRRKAKFVNAIIADAPKSIKATNPIYLKKKLTFPFSDAIVANSHAGLRSYGAPASKSVAIHNGFDMNRVSTLLDPKEIREKFNISTPHVVGMVGKFEDRKDYDTYISAAKKIVSERNDVSFLAIGDGKNYDMIVASVDPILRDRIIFTGRQSNVESIINVFTIGVLTTNDKIHGEGISNAILEYMVLGKPVVASRGGGTAEIVVDSETGFIIKPFDDNALAEKINYLLDYERESQKMGQLAAKRITDEFSLEKMTDSYIDLYNNLMHRLA